MTSEKTESGASTGPVAGPAAPTAADLAKLTSAQLRAGYLARTGTEASVRWQKGELIDKLLDTYALGPAGPPVLPADQQRTRKDGRAGPACPACGSTQTFVTHTQPVVKNLYPAFMKREPVALTRRYHLCGTCGKSFPTNEPANGHSDPRLQA